MNKYKRTIVILLIPVLLSGCYNMPPIEHTSVVVGIGYDIKNDIKPIFYDPIETLVIGENDEISSTILTGQYYTISSLVDERRRKQTNKFIYGTEVVYLISENRARYGIKDILDCFSRDPTIHTNAYVAVCKGECIDYFLKNKEKTGTNSEKLAELLKRLCDGNFFEPNISVNQVNLMNYQKGKNIIVPYIDMIENNPAVTGLAIFKEDKIVEKVSLNETRLINLLKNSDGIGIISILSDNPLEYIDIECKNKVKVTVSKKNDKLKYDIYVSLSNGLLYINTLYKEKLDKKTILEIEQQAKAQLTKDLNKEVEKIKQEMCVDCLNLSRYALAKYGINSGYDDISYFKNADIKVHVDVNLNIIGKKLD
jgi:Ger(x)C family germination protein